MQEEIDVQNYVSKFYGRRYLGNGGYYHQRIIKKMFHPKDGKTLDVGCGVGIVQSLYPHCDIHGIDISPEMIRLNPFEDRCKVGSADDIKSHYPPQHFDHVICRALLHHVDNPSLVLEEMRASLKLGGTISILETNASPLNRLPRKLLKKTKRFAGTHKNFEADELIKLVSQYFEEVTVEYLGYIAYPLIGFPDFINVPLPRRTAKWLTDKDEQISRGPFKRLAFNILLTAKRESCSSIPPHLTAKYISEM